MSVQTDAETELENARNKLSEAKKSLIVFLDSDTRGQDEFTEDFINDVEKLFLTINKFLRKR